MSELRELAHFAIGVVDLTTLNDDDTEQSITELCLHAKTAVGHTAAICIYPRFIPIARKTLAKVGAQDIKIATVVNFPLGRDDIDIALAETKAAIAYGADEVDLVFPYQALQDGDQQIGFDMVSACKKECGEAVLLKVIIEAGELASDFLITLASNISIDAGADFIKTSTGKVAVNATLEASRLMLEAIKASGKNVGFKAAGGVRTTEQAGQYLQLAKEIMGEEWVDASHFRFGASGLLTDLLKTVKGEYDGAPQGGY